MIVIYEMLAQLPLGGEQTFQPCKLIHRWVPALTQVHLKSQLGGGWVFTQPGLISCFGNFLFKHLRLLILLKEVACWERTGGGSRAKRWNPDSGNKAFGWSLHPERASDWTAPACAGATLDGGIWALDCWQIAANNSDFQGCCLQENKGSGCSLSRSFVQFDFLGKNPEFLSSLLTRGFHTGLLKP